MTKAKINITDIAQKSGFSISTVSRVLSGKGEQYRISPKTQQKIKALAKGLHYIPNQFAANLKSGKSNTIALIVPSLNNPFFASIASEINAEVRKFNYITIISDSDENPEVEKRELEQLMSRNIEGLIIVPCGNQWEHIKLLYDQGLPIVCIDRYFEDLDIPYVSTDNYKGAYTAALHLAKYGHTSIACIQGVQQSTPNRLRINGFEDAMKESGIKDYCVVGDDFTVQNGYLETKLLLQQKVRPTAIFTLSNTIAMGCMSALKEENVRIPEDISLITFDEHPYLDFLSTPLSCIAQPVSDISKIAIKFLFSRLNNHSQIKTANQVLLPPKIKYRESIRRIG